MKNLIIGSALLLFLGACSDDEVVDNTDKPNETPDLYFNVALQTSTVGTTETYVQALTEEEALKGEVSFINYGFEVPSTRAALLYGSKDGKTTFDLDYGGGTVTKFVTAGGEEYNQVSQININPIVGNNYPNFKVINDDIAFVQRVVNKNIFSDNDNTASGYQYTQSMATIADINLKDMTLGNSQTFEIPRIQVDGKDSYFYVARIDAPFILGDKVYFGLSKYEGNPKNPEEKFSDMDYPSASLVVDYPSLKNPKIIESKIGHRSTDSWRTATGYPDERGDAYQICETHMLKIANGQYDDSYDFDLSKVLGFEVRAQGWFYVGNGIGYATCYDYKKGRHEKDAAWFVARIDVYNKTAIKMNTPGNLFLQMYQRAKVVGDKLYMAICPVGGEGNIYIFDSKKADPNGFEKGAKLKTGAGALYIGIY